MVRFRREKIFVCRELSWIRIDPPPNSEPFRTRSYASDLTLSGFVLRRSRSSWIGDVKGW